MYSIIFIKDMTSFSIQMLIQCISSRFHRINKRLRILYSDLFESSITDYRRQNRSIFVQWITEVKDHSQYI